MMKFHPISVKAIPPLYSSNYEILWLKPWNRIKANFEIERLKSEGNYSLRLGIDCSLFNTDEGSNWYDWLVPSLAESFQLELCFDNFSNTNGDSISQGHNLTEVVEHFILKHGECFTLLELWRNPADREKQDNLSNVFACDVIFAATWANHLGKNVKLGRIQTLDFEWITKLVASQFLTNIQCIEIDKEGEDFWRTHTNFFERALRSLFQEHGIETDIYPNECAGDEQPTCGEMAS